MPWDMQVTYFLLSAASCIKHAFIPFFLQVVNAAPQVIHWKKKTSTIVVRVPGLYHLTIAVFTTATVTLQVYLNDEPLFALQPSAEGKQMR